MEHTLRLGEGITRLLPPADTQLILIYTPNIPLTVRYLFLLTLINRTKPEHAKIWIIRGWGVGLIEVGGGKKNGVGYYTHIHLKKF